MMAGGEALTYNMTHVLYNLMSNLECVEKLRLELSGLETPESGEIWRALGLDRLDRLPYLVSFLIT